MRRVFVALAGSLVLIGAALFYIVKERQDVTMAAPAAERLALTSGQLLFRDTDSGQVAAVSLTDPGGARRVSGVRCDRFAVARQTVAQQTAVCLIAQPGVLPPVTDILILDGNLAVRHRETLPGVPSRARVSPDGKLVAWTLFVTGDSYAATGFSTRAGLFEVDTGRLVKTIEELAVFVDDRRYFASDVNYWGITFADGNRFYASLGSKGKTYLIEADYPHYRGKAIRDNVECPSLSPDGTRIAFKKKVADGVWRLAVLDLATLRETELTESRSVDDQALWQDDSTILYGLDSAVWAVPADGTGSPRLLVRNAASPAVT
ncbi:PD40 domain-containing protein [Actinocrispum wychmicini]|uniref:WD40 repeat protein n=1 Tax=Actinocrispum wychmicini TaxID=1213861 RepID=A0A4V6NNR6_9PSEU|nr:PD40 domain-containing protein [Actinocrispum wychmicini]TCO53120.1 WD40 repeat protein [Actinocrispum wychmicini]